MTAIICLAEILACRHPKTHDIIRRHFTDIRLPSNTICAKELFLFVTHIFPECKSHALTLAIGLYFKSAWENRLK